MRFPNPVSYTGPIAASSRYGQVLLPFYQPGTSTISTIAINQSNVVAATFTGFTTAPSGLQLFTITSNLFRLGTLYQVTAMTETSTDAQMTVTKVQSQAGSVNITLQNLGTQALDGNVIIIVAIVPPYLN